ncbi:MAG: ABC transporter permease [Bdellovibrionales bacterium]|nr:ABC transporter permease [Bdellovibrionales bacterium]
MSGVVHPPKMDQMDRALKEPVLPPLHSPFSWKQAFLNVLQPIAAILLGVAFSLIAVKLLGDSPMLVLKTLVKSAVGTREDLGMTLFYATPLIFTGLSVAIAFQAGLFNIGAEGQLTFGAMAAAIVGIVGKNVPAPLAPVLGALAAMAAGAVWGFIPGWLRARRGSHEVINTIMMNFIAVGITSYLTLYVFKTEENQIPETAMVASQYLFTKWTWFGDTPLNFSFVLAILTAAFVWVILWRTTLGYEIRAVGDNEEAARTVGIDSARIRMIAMALAGAAAGMVGINEILGSSGKFKMGFSPEYGFIGIAVALLGRNRPLGVVCSALLFGALHKGAGALDMETEKVTRDFSQILQGLIILTVSATGFWEFLRKRRKRK